MHHGLLRMQNFFKFVEKSENKPVGIPSAVFLTANFCVSYWLQRHASDRKIAGAVPILGDTSLCFWKKTFLFNAKF